MVSECFFQTVLTEVNLKSEFFFADFHFTYINSSAVQNQDKKMVSECFFQTVLTEVNLKSEVFFADFVILEDKKMQFLTTLIVQTWRFLECPEVPRMTLLKGV